MDPALQQLVEAHRPYLTVTEDGKIKCELNGHQFPAKIELVSGFVNGGKYKKLVARREAEAALPKYDPFLVPSKNFPDKLFCALTAQLITRSLDAVKQHMRGRRFQKAKERFQEDKQDLLEEPSLEEEEQEAMDEGGEGDGGLGIWIPEGVEDEGEEGEEEDAEGDAEMGEASGRGDEAAAGAAQAAAEAGRLAGKAGGKRTGSKRQAGGGKAAGAGKQAAGGSSEQAARRKGQHTARQKQAAAAPAAANGASKQAQKPKAGKAGGPSRAKKPKTR